MRPAWSPRRATSILLRQVGAPRTRARMRKLLIVVALGLPSLARAATWTLDPAHTSVQFSVRHLMVSTVRGAFGKVTGTVQVDEKDLTRSKIQATLDGEGPTPEIKDPSGKVRAGAQATTKINRKDFGVTWNQVLEAGGVAVSDEVTITIDVEATKETAAGG